MLDWPPQTLQPVRVPSCAHQKAKMEPVSIEVVNENMGKLTARSLVQLLKQERQNHLRAGVWCVIQHLRGHTEGKGQQLLTNYRRAAFYLSERDKGTEGMRLHHAYDMLGLLAPSYTLPTSCLLLEFTQEECPPQQVEWSCPCEGQVDPTGHAGKGHQYRNCVRVVHDHFWASGTAFGRRKGSLVPCAWCM